MSENGLKEPQARWPRAALYKEYQLDLSRSAFGLVDVQYDFTPGGALAVTRGDEVVAPLNSLMKNYPWAFVFASQDWHPEDHCSFKDRGGLWPHHCVRGTQGANLRDELDQCFISLIVRKATQPDRDAYSAFDSTGLDALLRALGINTVFLGGLATDYCVKATALDAKKAEFNVVVALEACRAVNVNPDDEAKAVAEMRAAGIVCL